MASLPREVGKVRITEEFILRAVVEDLCQSAVCDTECADCILEVANLPDNRDEILEHLPEWVEYR